MGNCAFRFEPVLFFETRVLPTDLGAEIRPSDHFAFSASVVHGRGVSRETEEILEFSGVGVG